MTPLGGRAAACQPPRRQLSWPPHFTWNSITPPAQRTPRLLRTALVLACAQLRPHPQCDVHKSPVVAAVVCLALCVLVVSLLPISVYPVRHRLQTLRATQVLVGRGWQEATKAGRAEWQSRPGAPSAPRQPSAICHCPGSQLQQGLLRCYAAFTAWPARSSAVQKGSRVGVVIQPLPRAIQCITIQPLIRKGTTKQRPAQHSAARPHPRPSSPCGRGEAPWGWARHTPWLP